MNALKNVLFNKRNMRYRGPIESKKYNESLFQLEYSIELVKKELELNKNKINEIIEDYYLSTEESEIKSLNEQNGIVQNYNLIVDILRKKLSRKEA